MWMRYKWLVPVALAAITVACQEQPAEVAPAGTAPPVEFPVGPIPGVSQQPQSNNLDPYAQDKIALAEGRQLFLQYNCYGCHGGHAGGGMGPSLRDATWIYGDTDADIFNDIAEGRAHGMPSWAKRITEDQIWKLVAYIKSLRTPLEPDAPEQK